MILNSGDVIVTLKSAIVWSQNTNEINERYDIFLYGVHS